MKDYKATMFSVIVAFCVLLSCVVHAQHNHHNTSVRDVDRTIAVADIISRVLFPTQLVVQPQPVYQQPVYVQPQPVYQQPVYVQPQPVYYQPPVYITPPVVYYQPSQFQPRQYYHNPRPYYQPIPRQYYPNPDWRYRRR